MNLDLLKRVEAQPWTGNQNCPRQGAHRWRRPGQQGELRVRTPWRVGPQNTNRHCSVRWCCSKRRDDMACVQRDAPLFRPGVDPEPRLVTMNVWCDRVPDLPRQTRSGWRKWRRGRSATGSRSALCDAQGASDGLSAAGRMRRWPPPRPTASLQVHTLNWLRRLTVGPLHVGVHLADLVDDTVRCTQTQLSPGQVPCTNS
jgi:hypothetical protein